MDIDLYLENQQLKKEFSIRNLDLEQVWSPNPENIEVENRQLSSLLDWVEKYSQYKNRAEMESIGYDFPPVEPGFGPDSDWLRFERWVAGKPTKYALRDLLSPYIDAKNPNQLSDSEINEVVSRITTSLAEYGSAISVRPNIPPRLLYENLFLKMLLDDFEIYAGGGWHYDGCSGCCPECYQRPWCETGCTGCWPEDKELGKMVLPLEVLRYVSPYPPHLKIMIEEQKLHDKKMDEYMKTRPNNA